MEISDLSINYRNVVAHNPFFPETDGTLVFYRTTAKKKLDRPTLRLTLQEYTNLLDDIERLKKELPKILKDLEPGPNDRIVAALLGMPTIGPAPLNYEGLLGRQPQDSPNSESDPATNQKSARTPEAPRG